MLELSGTLSFSRHSEFIRDRCEDCCAIEDPLGPFPWLSVPLCDFGSSLPFVASLFRHLRGVVAIADKKSCLCGLFPPNGSLALCGALIRNDGHRQYQSPSRMTVLRSISSPCKAELSLGIGKPKKRGNDHVTYDVDSKYPELNLDRWD